MKRTVIVGATSNPARYAFLAAEDLTSHDHEIIPLSIKKGDVLGVPILNLRERPPVADVDTITLYIGPQHQAEWYDYLIGLKPKRIIFNPGTENPEFKTKAQQAGIQALEACTLVMLRTGQY
jgi:uncharacterized protein